MTLMKQSNSKYMWIGVAPILSVTLLAAVASADTGVANRGQNDGIFIAAGQVGGQGSNYATAGVIAPIPGSKLGDGWVERVFAEEISYRYKAGPRTIDASALGGVVSFGYMQAISNDWFGVYGGVAYHHTHLSPDDIYNNARGNEVAGYLQGEGEYNFTNDFKVNLNAVVEPSDDTSYWTRIRALYRVMGNVYAGPEGVYQGDRESKSWESGLAVVGVPVTDESSLGMDAGVRKTESVGAAGYVGLEFGLNF